MKNQTNNRVVSDRILAVMAAGGVYTEAWPLGRVSLMLTDGHTQRLFFDEAHVLEHHAILARESTPEGRSRADKAYVLTRINKQLEAA